MLTLTQHSLIFDSFLSSPLTVSTLTFLLSDLEIKSTNAVPYSKSHFCPIFRFLFPFRFSLCFPPLFRNQNQAAPRAGHKVAGQKYPCECNGPSGVSPFARVSSVVLSLGAGWCPTYLHSPPKKREKAARKAMQLMNLPISSGQGFE